VSNPTQQLYQILSEYAAKHERENWRGTVFCRFTFDEHGCRLERWSVDKPRTETGVGVRHYGGAK
jgi:hypothetical protein